MRGLLFAVCVLLGVALFPLPYGYYMFLRLAVCAYAVFVFLQERRYGVYFGSVTAVAIALLYNPLFPVHLEKDVWMWVNAGTVVLFLSIRAPWGSMWQKVKVPVIVMSVLLVLAAAVFAVVQFREKKERQSIAANERMQQEAEKAKQEEQEEQEEQKKIYRERKGANSKELILMDLVLFSAGDAGAKERFLARWGEDTLNRLELANEHDRAYMLGKRVMEVIGDGDRITGHQIYKNANNLWGTDVVSPDQIWKDFQGRNACIVEIEKRMNALNAKDWNNHGAEEFAKSFFKRQIQPQMPGIGETRDDASGEGTKKAQQVPGLVTWLLAGRF